MPSSRQEAPAEQLQLLRSIQDERRSALPESERFESCDDGGSRCSQRCRAGCRHCGRQVGLLFGIVGFGISRRRHERRCIQNQLLTRGYAVCNGGGVPSRRSSSSAHTSFSSCSEPPAPSGSSVFSEVFSSSSLGVLATALEQRRSCASSASGSAALRRFCAGDALPPGATEEVARSVRQGKVAQALDVVRCASSSFSAGAAPSSSPPRPLSFASAASSLPAPGVEPVELRWLRLLAPRFDEIRRRSRVPPPPDEGWSGPQVYSGRGVEVTGWYRWGGPELLQLVTKTELEGTLEQGLALTFEADLQPQWLPCNVKAVTDWSSSLPALVVDLHTKIPAMPRMMSTVIHRAFLDYTMDDGRPAIAELEWSPEEEHTVDGRFCGMAVPPVAPRTSRAGKVKLSTSVKYQADSKHICIIGAFDQVISRRLVPDFMLKPFLTRNNRHLSEGMATCLREFEQRGFGERVRADRHGAYARLRRALAAHAAGAADSGAGVGDLGS